MSSFDDIIQEKANNHEAPVPPGAWDNIVKDKKNRRFAFFWWIVVLLLSGLGIAGYYHFANNKKSNESVLSKNEIPVADGKTVSGTVQQPGLTVTKNNETETISSDIDKTISNTKEKQAIKNEDAKKNKFNHQRTDNNKESTGSKTTNTISEDEQSKIMIAGADAETIPVNKEHKKSRSKNKADLVPRDKKDQGNTENSIVTKNKRPKKQQGKSLIKMQAGETGVETETAQDEKNNNDIIQNTEPRNTVTGKTIESKKDLAADSTSAKDVATAPVENKTQPKEKRKQIKKNPWFIDLGISPVFPIEQYDRSVSFSRSLQLNNQLSEFSGKLVSTSIDPSLAFSIALRKKVSKKIIFGAGFQYLQLKENLHIAGTEKNTKISIVEKLIVGINGPELVSDTVKTITEGTREINATNSYRFLSIPVFIQYNFIQTRSWSLDIIGGTYITVNSMYKNEINKNAAALLTTSSQSTDKSNISVALNAGIRFGKIVNKRFELFGIPSMTWTLGQQNIKNSLLNKKIEQAGIRIGISYKLN